MHVIRMSFVSQMIALEAGMDESQAEILLHASPMHDIGKIGIPDHVLLKKGKLDADEWEIMKTHTTMGGRILGADDREPLRMARTVALTHHEKWNGKGYPKGLAGKDIPLEGRIVAIADVFDALTSERPYKRAWSVDSAVDLITQESGEHFDPDLVICFLNILPRVLRVKEDYKDSLDTGV